MGFPILDMGTGRMEKSWCVVRGRDRWAKDPWARQTGCQQGESQDGLSQIGWEQDGMWLNVKGAATLCRNGCICATLFSSMVIFKTGNLKDKDFLVSTIQCFSKDRPYWFFSWGIQYKPLQSLLFGGNSNCLFCISDIQGKTLGLDLWKYWVFTASFWVETALKMNRFIKLCMFRRRCLNWCQN